MAQNSAVFSHGIYVCFQHYAQCSAQMWLASTSVADSNLSPSLDVIKAKVAKIIFKVLQLNGRLLQFIFSMLCEVMTRYHNICK